LATQRGGVLMALLVMYVIKQKAIEARVCFRRVDDARKRARKKKKKIEKHSRYPSKTK
jgi:hypothetical protein